MVFSDDSFRNRAHALCWYGFAFQAGAINAGGFLACHSFVSHVTGIGTMVGIRLAKGETTGALELLIIPVSFLLGVLISAFLTDRRRMLGKSPAHLTAMGIIPLLLGFVLIGGHYGLFGIFGEPFVFGRDILLVSMLCMTCGLQNAYIASATRGQIRITHMTGVITDFGLTLVRIRYLRRFSKDRYREILTNRIRFWIFCFFSTGSALSSILFIKYEYAGFALPYATSLILFGALYLLGPSSVQISQRQILRTKILRQKTAGVVFTTGSDR